MTRRRRGSVWPYVAAALLLGSAAQAQIRLGPEFQVNTYTFSTENQAAIAVEADGDFVVVWKSTTQDGEVYGVFGKRFTSAGTVLGVEFQIPVRTLDNEDRPALGVDADGDFVVAWRSRNQDSNGDAVFARRFSSAGAAVGDEFQVNTYTFFAQGYPRVGVGSGGDFVVVWQSYHQDGSVTGVFGRRFSSTGSPLAAEFQISVYTTSHQKRPAVGLDAAGEFVVAWQSYQEDGDLDGIFARRFSSAGAAVGGEIQVNVYTTGIQEWPAMVVNANGDFTIAWSSVGQDGQAYGVFARRFSSAGASQGAEFQVNTYTISLQRYAGIAAEADGDFVVVWNSNGQESPSYGVFARRFSSSGAALAREFQVNTFTLGYQRHPVAGVAPDGHFVVAWSSSQDGASEGVFAQRFTLNDSLDVDGNGAVGPLTDGLLILRFLFGFGDGTLTSGALGGACTRCDGTLIQTYLTGVGMTIDIDGTGTLSPLTDGLLILRWLFGITGTPLTSGVVGSGCSRCDAAAIEPYLKGLTS